MDAVEICLVLEAMLMMMTPKCEDFSTIEHPGEFVFLLHLNNLPKLAKNSIHWGITHILSLYTASSQGTRKCKVLIDWKLF